MCEVRDGTRTFIVEPVDSVDTSTLMVSPQDKEVLGVLDLVCEQKADSLQGLLAAIYVVSQKEIVRLRREPPILKQSKQIVVLSVDIT